jgi:hypothetical protein
LLLFCGRGIGIQSRNFDARGFILCLVNGIQFVAIPPMSDAQDGFTADSDNNNNAKH